MAELWARIAADRGGHIAVAPFSRRVSPRCIVLLPALRAVLAGIPSSDLLLGDGLVGFTRIGHLGRGRRSTWEEVEASPDPPHQKHNRFAQDGVPLMHAAYSIGKPDGVGLALVFRNAPGLTQAIWGQDPVKSGTGQHCERRSGPCRHPGLASRALGRLKHTHTAASRPTPAKQLPPLHAPRSLPLHSAHALTFASR